MNKFDVMNCQLGYEIATGVESINKSLFTYDQCYENWTGPVQQEKLGIGPKSGLKTA